MNWNYLAGWFDAGGSIYIAQNNVRLLFQNTDEEVILAIQTFLELERLKINRREYKDRKTIYALQVTRQSDCMRIMREIVERCITKRPKIFEVLEWLKKREEEKWRKRKKKVRRKKPDVLYC